MKRFLAGGIVVAGMLAAGTVPAAALEFEPALSPGGTDYGTAADPGAVAIADFDGDGFDDVVSAHPTTDFLLVQEGEPDGSVFGLVTIPLPAADHHDVVAADFDDDGDSDLAAASDSGSVSVVLGQGDGAFGAPVTVDLADGSSPRAIAPGDLDRDGDVDLATANAGDGTISALLNNGAGTFTLPAQASATGADPRDVVLGDWNNDGILDAAVPNLAADQVSTLIGDGAGGFGAPTVKSTPDPAALATGDFNSDGNRDVAIARRNGATGSTQLMLGDGAGVFTFADTSALPSFPNGIVAADTDRDGDDDLVTSNESDQVALLKSDGTGNIGAAAPFSAGTSPTGIAAGDIDGDGVHDFAASTLGDSVNVLLGDGASVLGSAKPYDTGLLTNVGGGGDMVQIANLNDNTDSHLDVAVAATSGGNSRAGLFLGTGSGTLGDVSAINLGNGFGGGQISMQTADFNEDGNLDLVAAHAAPDVVTLALGNGTGGFAAPTTHPVGDGPFSLEVGDFDEDNDLDVATTNINNDTLSVRLGTGTGSFAAPVTTSVSANNPFSISAGDFDADGDDDIALHDNFNSDAGAPIVSILVSNGDGTFAAGQAYELSEFGSSGPEITDGDITGDGDLDLVVAAGNVISVLRGGTGATFSVTQELQTQSTNASAELADMDGDGDRDVISADDGTSAAAVYFNNGSGTFAEAERFATGGFAVRDVTAGDLNGDGKRDLATSNVGSNDVSVLLQRSPDAAAPQTRIEVRPAATTADQRPSFTFASNEVGATFQCSVDSGTPDWGPCSGPGAMHTSGFLPAGDYAFRVRATDRAGNTDASPAEFGFGVTDAVAPNTKITKVQIKRKARSAKFTFTSTEPGSKFRCKIDRKAFRPCGSPKTYRRLKKGRHTFQVVARDAAGNTDPTPAKKKFRIR